jgi:Carboxypeptidase regulatory-like domain
MKSAIVKAAVCLVFALAVLPGYRALAQNGTATLTGTVEDKSGAMIPNAHIVLTEVASGVTRTTQTNQNGFFSLVSIPAAVYNIEASATGFKSLRQTGIEVHISDQLQIKGLVLEIAGKTESVTVTTEAAEITPSTSGEVSYTLSDTEIHNLNVAGRSAIELLGLIPGSGNTGNFNGQYTGQQAGFVQNASAFTVNGNRFDQVQITSDGASVTDLNTAAATSVTPNVEMISELKVQSAAYSAAEPNGPIVVSTVTKSGGNKYHGEGYLTARNHALNANDWQQLANGLPQPQTGLYYGGAQVGGPIVKEKLFFFAASEIAQQHVDMGVRHSAVPTPDMRKGIFTDTATLNSFSTASNNYRYWAAAIQPCQYAPLPSYCSDFGVISPTAIDPGGQALLNAFPLPNVDPTLPVNNGNNLITDFVTSNPRNQENLRLDVAPTQNTHAYVRFNHENESVPWPYGPYNQWNLTPYPASQTGKNAANSVSASVNNVLNPTLTNDFSVAFFRSTIHQVVTNLDLVSRTALGYPYSNFFPYSGDTVPNVKFDGNLGQLYLGGGEVPPYTGAQNNITFNEGLTKLKGNHLLRAGFFAQVGFFNNLTQGNDNGSVTTQNYICPPDPAGNGCNDWGLLLMGNIANYNQTSGNIMAHMKEKRFDFYGQDTWKAGRRLTLNYGLRVDHIGWWYDTGGHIGVFVPSAYSSSVQYSGIESHATTPSIPLSGAKPLGFQWAPSVGFAYDLTGSGNTVLRGGFGTNYYTDPGINSYSAIQSPPNFTVMNLWSTTTLSGISSLPYSWSSNTPATVWGTANPTDHRSPVTYSWNFGVQNKLPGSNNLQINYVGNVSRNLVGYGATNVVPEGCEIGPWYGTWSQQPCRPYSNYGEISKDFHNLNSSYNAAQIMFTRQKGWLNYWASYTFGKTLAYNAEDAFDMKRWYGPAPFDRTQILSFSYYIALPNVGRDHLGNNKAVNGMLDGWHVSGILQLMSGGPIGNFSTAGNSNFGSEYGLNADQIGIYGSVPLTVNGNYNQSAPIGGELTNGTYDEAAVPLMVCDPRRGLKRNQYFNPACFVAPSYMANGTYRLPYIHGPAYENDSLGLFKTFSITESKKLEIRAEAFNLFNHPYNEFIAYDSNMYMGFSAMGEGTASTSAGTADNKTGHREIALTAKFWF